MIVLRSKVKLISLEQFLSTLHFINSLVNKVDLFKVIAIRSKHLLVILTFLNPIKTYNWNPPTNCHQSFESSHVSLHHQKIKFLIDILHIQEIFSFQLRMKSRTKNSLAYKTSSRVKNHLTASTELNLLLKRLTRLLFSVVFFFRWMTNLNFCLFWFWRFFRLLWQKRVFWSLVCTAFFILVLRLLLSCRRNTFWFAWIDTFFFILAQFQLLFFTLGIC